MVLRGSRASYPQPPISALYFGALFTLASVCFCLFRDAIKDEPCVDEFFHLSQTRAYCTTLSANWNSKITTFPGLYWFAVMIHRLAPFPLECSNTSLRLINLIFFALLSVLFPRVLYVQSRFKNLGSVLKYSAMLMLFPVLYFFFFLFYTDAGGLFFILLTLYFHETQRLRLAAVSGLWAVLFRQNNIIWVLTFCLADVMADFAPVFLRCRSRFEGVRRFPAFVLGNLWKLAGRFSSQILLLLGFFVFLVWNDFSTVLGHKEFHENKLHLSQLLYFSFLYATSTAFFFVDSVYARRFFAFAARHPILVVGAFAFSAASLWCSFHVHLFLLSDNRHYMFYLFRWIINRTPLTRYLLVPLFALSLVKLVFDVSLLDYNRKARAMGLLLGTALYLASAVLVEFRYFIVPTILLMVAVYPVGSSFVRFSAGIWLNILCFAVVNVTVILVFLEYTFVYTDLSVGRFMW
eukprot:ANDGO_08572.mRNA.1 Dol-P-Glc:Glc(2)Man(9)GlcNAc(2)-PP-Dol alpha-1